MLYLIITVTTISLISIIFLTISLALHYNHKRYVSFVTKNSVSLCALKKINSEFTFYPFVNFDQSYTYDNEDYYENISCEDYLIYQLQSQVQAQKITAQIKKMNRNKIEYNKYIARLKILKFGDFSAPIGRLKRTTLLKIENKLYNETKFEPPPMQFSLTVTLYCINGRIYASKYDNFSGDIILSLVKRLNNRNGTYYRDRQIWDAICRVERGKVSNKMRFSIYKRDGYRCKRCGISQRDAKLEIDHIIPISKGGKSTYKNLQTLCHECNVEKGDSINIFPR